MGTIKKVKSSSGASPLDSDEPTPTPGSGETNTTRNTSGTCSIGTTSPNSLATSAVPTLNPINVPAVATSTAMPSTHGSTSGAGLAPIPSTIIPASTHRVSDINVIPEGTRVAIPHPTYPANSPCTGVPVTSGVIRKKGPCTVPNPAITTVVAPFAIVVPSTTPASGGQSSNGTSSGSPAPPPPPSSSTSSSIPSGGNGAAAPAAGVPKASSTKDLAVNEKLPQAAAPNAAVVGGSTASSFAGCQSPAVSGVPTTLVAVPSTGNAVAGSFRSTSPSTTECTFSFPSSTTLPTTGSTQWFSFAYTGKTAVEEESVVLKDYVFGHRLGEGTYGSVYVVTYTPSGERFAMKVLQKEAVEAFEDQIVREATLMQSLDHPHVVKLVKFLESKTAYYLLMELAEGGELFDLILSSSYFDEPTARRYFHQLMSAIEYCHSKGIAHRDLKAENLLLAENERLTVCDFGFSWMSPAEADEDIEEGEEAYELEVGTVHYLPPEMVSMRKSETNGFQQDLWSAGVILFFMLTGRMPFDGREEAETMHLIEQAELHFTDDELNRLSDGARELLEDMLKRDPLARPTLKTITRDYAWFAEDLNGSMISSTTAASITSRQTTTFLDFSTPHAVTDAEEKSIRSAFDKIDVDGFGRITRDQVRDMLITLCDGNPVRSSDVLELMKLFTGSENSESVTFEEFHRAWVDKDLAHCKFTYNNRFQLPQILATKHEEVEREVVRQLRTAFDFVDAEHSGIITNRQWRELFDRCKIPVSDDEIQSVISFLDTCKCGSVSFEEFLVAIVQREMLVRHPMGRKLAAAMNLVGMLRARNVSDCVHHGFFVIGLQHAVLDKMLRYPRRLVLLCKDNDASPTDNVYTFRYFSDPLRASNSSCSGSPTLQDSLHVSVPTPEISSSGYGTPLYNDLHHTPTSQFGDHLGAPQVLPAPMSVTHDAFKVPHVVRYANQTQTTQQKQADKPSDATRTTTPNSKAAPPAKAGSHSAASPTTTGGPIGASLGTNASRTSMSDITSLQTSSKPASTKLATRDGFSSNEPTSAAQCKRRGVPMVSVPCTPGNVVSLHHSSFSPCTTAHSASPTDRHAPSSAMTNGATKESCKQTGSSTAVKGDDRKSRTRPPQLTSNSNNSLDKAPNSADQTRQNRQISTRPSCEDANLIGIEAEPATLSPHLKNSFGNNANGSFGDRPKKESCDLGSSITSKRGTPVVSRTTPTASRPGGAAGSEERSGAAGKSASPTTEGPSKLRHRSDSTDSMNYFMTTPRSSKPAKTSISRAGMKTSIPPFTVLAASSKGLDEQRQDKMQKSTSQGSLVEAERNSFAYHSTSSGKESPGSSLTCSPACSNPPATSTTVDAIESKKSSHCASHSPQSTKNRESRHQGHHNKNDRSRSPTDLLRKKQLPPKNASVDDLHVLSSKPNATPSAGRSTTPRTAMNTTFSSDWKRKDSGTKSPRRPVSTTTPSRTANQQSGPLVSPRRVAGTSCASAKPVVDASERKERGCEATVEKDLDQPPMSCKEKVGLASHKDPAVQHALREEGPLGDKKKKVTVENGSVASSSHGHHHHNHHGHHGHHSHHSPSPSNKGTGAAAMKKVRSGELAVRVKRGKHRMEALNGVGLCDFNLILSPACMGYTLVRFCRIHGKTLDFHEAVQFVSTVLDREREQAKTDTMAKGDSEFM